MLVPEEELSDTDLAALRLEQRQKEINALRDVSQEAAERAAIVRQLVAERYTESSQPLSEEVMKRIQRRWSRFSITEEDEIESSQTNELTMTPVGSDKDGAELDAALASVDQLNDGDDDVAGGMVDDNESYQLETVLPEFDKLEKGFLLESTDDDGEEDDDVQIIEPSKKMLYPDEMDELFNGRPAETDFSFVEILSACKTLGCIHEAHNRRRGEGQFAFPAAILLGWEGSSISGLTFHLNEHPQVINAPNAVSNFFTTQCTESPSFECSLQSQADYITKTLQRDTVVAAQGKIMAFESTTTLAAQGMTRAADIATALPWIKLTAVIREPISRIATLLIRQASELNVGCLASLEANFYACLVDELKAAGEHGVASAGYSMYSQSLTHWLSEFPEGQLLLIQDEEVRKSEGLRDVKEFLSIDPALPLNTQLEPELPEDASKGWFITRQQYLQLVDIVKPDAERVAQMAEDNGDGSKEAWMERWQAVWDATLATCTGGDDTSDQCHIALSTSS